VRRFSVLRVMGHVPWAMEMHFKGVIGRKLCGVHLERRESYKDLTGHNTEPRGIVGFRSFVF
jgi:hypothetical protein